MRYLFLLLLIGTSIGVFFTFIKPKYDLIKKTKSEVSVSDAKLTTAETLQESRDKLIKKYNDINKADLDNLKIMLPDSVDNIRLIIQINSIANKNGLSALRSVDYKSNDDKSNGGAVKLDINNQKYGEIIVTFQTSGQYKNFIAFLADLEKNLRLVDVVSVDFSSGDNSKAENGLANFLTYKITLKTYWLKQ